MLEKSVENYFSRILLAYILEYTVPETIRVAVSFPSTWPCKNITKAPNDYELTNNVS